MAYGKLLMRFLIGGRLPGKLDILLDALAVDLVDAFLTRRSHVVKPGFSESQGREVKMEWTPSDQKAWRQWPSFIYTHTHSYVCRSTGPSKLQH